VKTDSIHSPAGLYTKGAHTIAAALASKQVSSKGPGSGMRMLIYFIKRARRNRSTRTRSELRGARVLLPDKIKKRNKTHQRKTDAQLP
jgi:hypothetical protein